MPPSQALQDALSQRWVIATGRTFDPAQTPWLAGPYGDTDIIADRYIHRLAHDENLTIERHPASAGLIESADDWGLDPDARARLHPDVIDFYQHTADYDMDVWSQWNGVFKPFGCSLHRLYSRRLQQLNLPLDPLETSRGLTSEILKLRDDTGRARYTAWFRTLKATGQVVYSGLYSTCSLADGRRCVKVIFPLPRGSATVLMSIEVDQHGALNLISSGERFGDPGFYFLLADRHDRHHARFVRSFRETIRVYVDDERELRTDHTLTVFRRNVLRLHYRLRKPTTP